MAAVAIAASAALPPACKMRKPACAAMGLLAETMPRRATTMLRREAKSKFICFMGFIERRTFCVTLILADYSASAMAKYDRCLSVCLGHVGGCLRVGDRCAGGCPFVKLIQGHKADEDADAFDGNHEAHPRAIPCVVIDTI